MTRVLAGTVLWSLTLVASAAAAATGAVSPGTGTIAAFAALAGVAWHVHPGLTRPEVGLFGPAITRGRHPGRAALTVDGPRPDLLPVLRERGARATFFVPAGTTVEGHETGLAYAGWPSRRRIDRVRAGARWVRSRWLGPGLRGLPIVGASARLRRVADGRRVVGTDVVDVSALTAPQLDDVLREWDSRAIVAVSLSEALDEVG